MRCEAVAEVNGFSVGFCSFKKGDVISNRLTHGRAREGVWKSALFLKQATSTGPWRLAGAGLSPGTAVISLSHDRECSEAVGKRGCSPGESRAPRRALAPSSHLALLRQNDESQQ